MWQTRTSDPRHCSFDGLTCSELSYLLKEYCTVNSTPPVSKKIPNMIVTDANNLEAGAREFIYVCKKRPFSITCSPYFQKISETYIDLDLVLKMDIPVKNFQCTRIAISGHPTRIVGQISQTVQCVVSGKLCGTSHLKAKVVRDLAKIFNTDCIAGQQLYKKLMDPTVNVISKGDKHEDSNTSIQGTLDTYTNVSHVIANSAHEDETISCDDDAMSESSYDAELLKYLSTQDELTRDQTFAEYPELTRLSKFFDRKSSIDQLHPAGISKDKVITGSRSTQAQHHEDETINCDDDVNDSSHDEHLLQYLSTQDERTRDQNFYDYPELARFAKFFTKNSIDQPQPVVISKDQAVTDSSRPACKSPVFRFAPTCTELVQVPKSSQPVHKTFPAAAVLSAHRDSTLAAFAASLPVGRTDAYVAALNAPTEVDDASDTSSVRSLARAHGYDDTGLVSLARAHGYDDTGPCDDASAQLSSYAMPHCMLCEVSGQPDTITFSHDTDDPYCPSYFDDEKEEDPGGGRRR